MPIAPRPRPSTISGVTRDASRICARSPRTRGSAGAGRLLDLMVVCEALTPGEIRLRGAGLIIHYGFAGTPLGRLVIGVTVRGICHAQFVDDGDDQAAARRLVEAWPRAEFVRDEVGAETIARRIFGNHASDLSHLHIS